MYGLWLTNTAVFIFQVVVCGGIYALTGDVAATRTSFAALAATGSIAAFFASFIIGIDNRVELPVILSSMLASLSVVLFLIFAPRSTPSMLEELVLGLLFVVPSLILCGIAASMAEKKDEGNTKQSFLSFFLTALPGIGTVIGVPILLYRWLKRNKKRLGKKYLLAL